MFVIYVKDSEKMITRERILQDRYNDIILASPTRNPRQSLPLHPLPAGEATCPLLLCPPLWRREGLGTLGFRCGVVVRSPRDSVLFLNNVVVMVMATPCRSKIRFNPLLAHLVDDIEEGKVLSGLVDIT